MLSQLSVKNFAIAEHVEVLFDKGMSVLSGETGAGKSIILGALGLALGDRADTSMVRFGQDKAEVSAVFQLPPKSKGVDWLKDHDLEDGDQCILRRVITAEGRSRGYINGQPCPLQHLKTIGEFLIDVHSQHEHQSLLNKENHRIVVDSYGQLDALAQDLAHAFAEWKNKEKTLTQLETNQDEVQARLQLLTFQVDELETVDLQAGEITKLESEQSELSNAGLLIERTHEALTICSDGDENLSSMLANATSAISGLPTDNPQLAEALSLLCEAQIQIDEAGNSLRHFADAFEVNPERLQSIEERLSVSYQLARKHRCEPEELPNKLEELRGEMSRLNTDQDLDTLTKEVASLKAKFNKQAKELSRRRQEHARTLEAEVSKQLKLLDMKGVGFYVQLEPLPERSVNQHGLDSLEFLVSTNAGQPAKPLRKVASGGELSRISLAIQVAIAQRSTIPTLVFDEVDVGISGGTAQIVGRLLRSLGSQGQVICVTHQAQVASQGHQHFFISKHEKDQTVRSAVDKLSEEERTQEIARMLGGIKITEQTIAHAKEMLSEC
jgi:DNA repair protein RecN (Recombination protein N)